MSSLNQREDGAVASFEPVFTCGALIVPVGLLLGGTTINFIDRQTVSRGLGLWG
jgi:hypothetical protein